MCKKFSLLMALLIASSVTVAKDYVPFIQLKPKEADIAEKYAHSVIFFFRFDCKYSRDLGQQIEAWQTTLPESVEMYWVPVMEPSSDSDFKQVAGYYTSIVMGGSQGAMNYRRALNDWFAKGHPRSVSIGDIESVAALSGFDSKAFVRVMATSDDVRRSTLNAAHLALSYEISNIPVMSVGNIGTAPVMLPPEMRDKFIPLLSGLVSRMIE